MQHYGLPTRLLDFTYNSLVALFFACCGEPNCDGIVYAIHGFQMYDEDFVWLSIITKYIYESDSLGLDIGQMLCEIKDNPDYPSKDVVSFYSEESILKILTSPIGVYPKFTNERIRCQDGVFIIPGMTIVAKKDSRIFFDKKSYSDIHDLWPESRAVIIPANCKKQILQDLSKLGIHYGKLFPELELQTKYVTQILDL